MDADGKGWQNRPHDDGKICGIGPDEEGFAEGRLSRRARLWNTPKLPDG